VVKVMKDKVQLPNRVKWAVEDAQVTLASVVESTIKTLEARPLDSLSELFDFSLLEKRSPSGRQRLHRQHVEFLDAFAHRLGLDEEQCSAGAGEG
jgi:hypothetical protein